MDPREAWSQGDIVALGELLEDAAYHLADLGRVGPEMRVLDIGTGSGNVAYLCARRAAEVSAVDVTDVWFDHVQQRASAGNVSVDLRLGRAEDLPFQDDTFDRVLSCFAMIFAPDHDAAAREAVRVCRPGGAIAFTAWRPDSPGSKALQRLRPYLPEPEGGWPQSDRWGDEDHVRDRFAAYDVTWGFHPGAVELRYPSPGDYLDHLTRASGPFVMVRAALEEAGTWDQARDDVIGALAEANEAADGSFALDLPYHLAVGLVPE